MGMLRKKDKSSKSATEPVSDLEAMGVMKKKEKSSKSFRGDRTTMGRDENVDNADGGALYSEVYHAPEASVGDSETTGPTQRSSGTGRKERSSKDRSNGPWFTSRQIRLFKKPPPAEEAAYSGPPRYDWVDIETSAAIKIQAAYRRKRVLDLMEEGGQLNTAAVRNLARRRRAAKEASTNPAKDFINLFNCCGVDLGLGGGNRERYWDVSREIETARYEESRREKAEREEKLRQNYRRKATTNRHNLVENVEVVQ